jgi:acetolactate synthase-1/2/3 large subunit
MAQGYARATGNPGVALVTSGSGVTSMVTPMQDALCDGTPMVVLCGQAPSTFSDVDEFQQSDVLSVTKPCTKWNVTVHSVSDLSQRINEAFEVATSGRPGPVLVNIPRHIFKSVLTRRSRSTDFTKDSFSIRLNAAAFNVSAASNYSLKQTLDRVAHLVNISNKPILYVGQGILSRPEGAAVLKEFAKKASIPVTTSLQGLGAFDELDPKALHMLGLHGAGYANLPSKKPTSFLRLAQDLMIELQALFQNLPHKL